MIPLSLNQNSCKDLSLEDFIKFSKKFMGVELKYKAIKHYLNNNNRIKDIFEYLEIYNLKVNNILQLKDFSLCSERDYKNKVLIQLKQIIGYCYKLESNLITVSPSYLEDSSEMKTIPKWRIIDKTRKRLEDISKKAYKEGVNIGLELIPNKEPKITSTPTMEDTKEIMRPLESQENLGYIIDAFYLAKAKVDFTQLNDIKENILLIQLCDLKLNSSEKENNHEKPERIFPAEFSKNLIKHVMKLRYKRGFSIEMSKNECSKDLYKMFFENFKNL